MKICVFSDIHGNGALFRAAFPGILREAADRNIFLGDLCGYYLDEIKIFEQLSTLPNFFAIRGNHDKMFLAAAKGDQDLRTAYRSQFGSSLENFLQKDHRALVKWLESLPDVFEEKTLGLGCYHASPWGLTEEYVYPDSPLQRFQEFGFDNFFLGHTHHPMKRWIGEKMILNPGSLGQPRHGGRPTYAVVELPQRTVEFREIV